MEYAIILNPAAGHGRAGRKRRQFEAALRAAELDYRLLETKGPGHATELAREAAGEARVVVAVGGDGTIHEVGQGLAEAGASAVLGIIPSGTGNDLVRTLRIPHAVQEAVAILTTAHARPLDHGTIRWADGGGVRQGIVMNGIGAGVDAAVAERATSFKGFPGKSAYVCAIPGVLARWKTPEVRVRLGTWEQPGALVYEGPLFLMAASNGKSTGGGFMLTPEAQVDDGHFDLCVVERLGASRIFQLLPKAMRGAHTGAPEVHMRTLEAVTLESDTPIPLHADGEVISCGTQRLEVQVVPGGLSVLAPG